MFNWVVNQFHNNIFTVVVFIIQILNYKSLILPHLVKLSVALMSPAA